MPRLLAILLLYLPTLCLADTGKPYFRHYGVEQGLSNNRIFCTIQDAFGFLWIGTADGLNRFDGYQFKVFRNTPGDPRSLGDNVINSLLPLPDALLVGTNTGLYRFEYATEKFRQLVWSRHPVGHLCQDKAGNIWYVAGRQLKKYQPRTGRLTTFAHQQLLQASSVSVAADGSIWAASATGWLCQVDTAGNITKAFDLFAHSPRAASRKVLRLCPTSDTSMLVGTSNQGVKLFSIKQSTYQDLLTHTEEGAELIVFGFLENGPSEYWVGTETGIYIIDPKTRKYRHLRKGFTNPASLSDNDINTLCRDREGGIWAGTNFGGLNYHPRQYSPFQAYFPGSDTHPLSGNVVHEITADSQGQLWVGTEDAGLNKLDIRKGKTTYFLPTGQPDAIAYTNIHGLVADGNELWVGTHEHGLDVLDVKTGKVLHHFTSGTAPGQLGSNFIVTLYHSRSGDILAGTLNGLYRYRRQHNDFELFLNFSGQVQNIAEDASGNYWLCTLGNGVYFFDLKKGRQRHLVYQQADKNSLANNIVHGQYHDTRGFIWFSTESGLSRYEPRTGIFRHYTTEDGLPGNVVYRVEEDRHQRLWISTTKGLARLDLRSGAIRSYTKENGLPSDHFNFNSSFQDSSGRLYFGTLKGLVSFQPLDFVSETFVPPLFFTDINISGPVQRKGSNSDPVSRNISFENSLRLQHNQATFSIDFAALSFTAPAMTRYRYRLEGLENAWTQLQTNRRIYFTSLQPGQYTLKLQVLSPEGTKVVTEKNLRITVLPPWWASPTAYAVYLLLVACGIYFLLRYYHRYNKAKAARKIELMALKKEKELYEAKMDFFTHVAHEIRTPLTLIKAPLERVLHKTAGLPDVQRNLRTMERNTDRLIDLTGQLLDFRKAEANGFRLAFVPTVVTDMLREQVQQERVFAEQKGIAVQTKIPAQPITAYADPEALHKIFSNLLHNAIKYAHSKAGVELTADNAGCTITFWNDGPLVPPEMRDRIFEPFFRLKVAGNPGGTGVGLALARTLVSLHGGRLQLAPHPGLNVFVLALPNNQQPTTTENQIQTLTPV